MNVQSLLLAVMQSEDTEAVTNALTEVGLHVTRISSVGGFLQAGNATLLLGLESEQVEHAIELLMSKCHRRTTFVNAGMGAPGTRAPGVIMPLEVEISGVTLFVLPVERFACFDAQKQTVTFERQDRREGIMKLVIVIVPEELSTEVLDALVAAQYRATLISTTGGFLRKGNATLLIGVESRKVDDVLMRIKDVCAMAPGKDSGAASATIFVLDTEQYKQV